MLLVQILQKWVNYKKRGQNFGKKGNKIFRKLEKFPIPVIAVINGFALGGDCDIAMSYDIRICSDNAIFGQLEICHGITPGFWGSQIMARIVGSGIEKQIIFTREIIDANEALRIGLVNKIFPQNELMKEDKKIAQNIGKKILIEVKNSKRAINDGLQANIDNAIQIEEKLFGDCFENTEQIEAMNNLLNKGKSK